MKITSLALTICIIVYSDSSFAKKNTYDLSRIYRCDSLLCPENSSGGDDGQAAREQLKNRVGIVLTPSRPRLIELSTTTITVEDTIQPTALVEPTSVRPTANPNDAAGNADTGETQQLGNSNNNNIKAASLGGVQSRGGNPNSRLKAGGFLYSDDDSGGDGGTNIDVGSAVTTGGALSGLQNTDPVAQNKQLGGQDEGDTQPFRAAGVGGAGFGSFSGGTGAPVPKKSLGAQITDGLASIADSLGKKFFGSLGRKGQRGKKLLSKKLGKKGKLDLENAAELDRHLLKRGLARFNGRSGKLEFGRARSFMFQDMCQHYVDYAKRNAIPNDRSPCPRK